MRSFYEVFGNKKPIIGMIHLAGENETDVVNRAIDEITIYEQEGFDAALVEDFHGNVRDVLNTFERIRELKKEKEFNLIFGVNLLRNPYLGFEIADEYGAKFVQFDSVQKQDLDVPKYTSYRIKFPDIAVLGGIRFKHKPSYTGNSLEKDIKDGKNRCEAIVTTGNATGAETPIGKLEEFREILGAYPLLAGSGVNESNIRAQMKYVNGVIVGSYLKDYNTQNRVMRTCVRELVEAVKG